MAAVLVELELHVLAADLQEAVVDLLDALAVVADRIAVAGHEVDRGGLVHLIEIFRLPDILQAAHHIMEHAGRRHRAAERVSDVLIHDRLVARQPVEVRAYMVVLLVVAAEGELIELGAVVHRTIVDHLELGHKLTGGDDGGRVLTGAADDDALESLRVVNDVGAGQEAAHAVAEQEVGDIGILGGGQLVELVHVAHNIVPAVLFRKEAQLLLVFGSFAVAEVIIGDDDKAVAGQKLHERGIAVNVLGDAVRDLQNGANFAVGGAFSCKYLVFPVSGQKPEIMKRWHSNTPPVVIY